MLTATLYNSNKVKTNYFYKFFLATVLMFSFAAGAVAQYNCPGNQTVYTHSDSCGVRVTYTYTPTSSVIGSNTTHVFAGATAGAGPGDGSSSTFNLGVTNVRIITTYPPLTTSPDTCNFTITVLNPASGTIQGDAAVCIGIPIQYFTDSSAAIYGGGKWYGNAPAIASVDSMTGFVTGIAAGDFILSYVVKTSCTIAYNKTVTKNLTVNPTPNVTASIISQTICSGSGAGFQTINLSTTTSTSAGTVVYNWTRDNTSNVTGTSNVGNTAGSGNSISGTLTNTTNTPQTVTFTITPRYQKTGSAKNCDGTPITSTVTVNPTPNATATLSTQTICSGAIAPILLTSNVTGTTYTWIRDNATATGIATSGSGDITGTLNNATSVAQTVLFTITPHYTNGGVTCTGANTTATVIVNPTPAIAATRVGTGDVCPGSNIVFNVTETHSVGGTFNWIAKDAAGATLATASNVDYGNAAVNTNLGAACPYNKEVTFTFTPVGPAATHCLGTAVPSAVVEVRDIVAPTFTTTAGNLDRTVECSDAAGLAAAQALVPVSTDNCTTSMTAVKTSGAFVAGSTCPAAGTYHNSFIVTDNCGNASTVYSQTITITDHTSPVLNTVPTQSLNVGTDANCTAPMPDYRNLVTVTDCSTVTLEQLSPNAPGTSVTYGPTRTVVIKATDACGNISQTSFQLNIIDNTAPVITTCAPAQTASANGSCSATVPDFTAHVVARDNCTASLIITQSPAAGTSQSTGTQNVTITVTDAAGNSTTCTTSFKVTDNTKPVITNCPSNITVTSTNGNSSTCTQTATWTAPTATDNCAVSTFTSDHAIGSIFFVGTTTVTYTATDIHGNTSTCSFTVTVTDDTKPVLTACPSNITVKSSNGNSSNCFQAATWTAPTAIDNCGVATVSSDHHSGDAFPLGTTTVIYTATDIHGNTSTCSFLVTVVDDTKPVFTSCPSNITSAVNAAGCMAMLTTTDPTVTDNCATPALTWSMAGATTATGSGNVGTYSFSVGTTTVTYTATDAAGNTATCAYTVTVSSTLAGNISGTTTVQQNSSTTANVTFTGSGGTKPYTFTYNVTNAGTAGPNQTVSTSGTNNVTTVAQSNAVVGQFVYTLLSVADAYGCAVPYTTGNTATITVVQSVPNPDFTPVIAINNLQIAATTGSTKDFIVNIMELTGHPSTGQIIFKISEPKALEILFSNVSGESIVTAGASTTTANANGDWDITKAGTIITCTLKSSSTIPASGVSKIGFTAKRRPGVAPGQTASIIAKITAGSGGDSKSTNNITNVVITAQ